eukprot:m.103439 g.103439  ORF g.103439 m.103439 type:complete len:65 (+) comp15576_c0_seq3:1035-1229(+)
MSQPTARGCTQYVWPGSNHLCCSPFLEICFHTFQFVTNIEGFKTNEMEKQAKEFQEVISEVKQS